MCHFAYVVKYAIGHICHFAYSDNYAIWHVILHIHLTMQFDTQKSLKISIFVTLHFATHM